MSIERTFDLIINAGTSSPLIINANQNDSGEIWKFNLYQEDGTKVIPAAGEIVGLKSDGHAIVNAGTVNASGQVVITETAQITAAVGANVFEIVFDSVHGTANFILYVEKSPVDDDADFSESDISAIQQAIAMAIDAQTVAALQTGLQNEAQTRYEQDTLLAGGIAGEAATRAAADAVLRQAIDDAAIVPAGSTVVVDDTLSIAGAAADAKKTGDAISDLDAAVGQYLMGKTETSGIGDTYDFPIVVGKTYLFGVPNADIDNASISFSTRNASGAYVEDGVSAEKNNPYVVFTPTQNAVKIRIFSSRPGEWIINEISDSLSYRLLQDERDIKENSEKINQRIKHYPLIITTANYSTLMPDINELPLENVEYVCRFTEADHPLNMPDAFPEYGNVIRVVTSYTKYYENSQSAVFTVYLTDHAKTPLFYKTCNISGTGVKTWGGWNPSGSIIFTVGANQRYSSIYDACQDAITYKNSIVIVKKKETDYDLISEIGSDLTESFGGIRIGNGMTLLFDPLVNVICNYTGGVGQIQEVFSPFTVASGDVTIDGLNIEAKNVRYCIHDEVGGESSKATHIYKNCNMMIDNSEKIQFPTTQCIGGGLGRQTVIEVTDCVFDSVCNASDPVVSWHSSNHYNDAFCKVNIKNNYYKHGTVRAGCVGSSTAKTPFIVCNNSVESAVYKITETAGAQDNIDLLSFNNEIRN